jgi:hypothetical protein
LLTYRKPWLSDLSWDKLQALNATLCQAQNVAPKPNGGRFDTAREQWEKTAAQPLPLPEVLDRCRKCEALSPFVFNNGNTFAASAKGLAEDWVKTLPPVEAHIVRTTIGHYVAGQVDRQELLQVLQHFDGTWNDNGVAAPREEPQRLAG